MTTATPAIRKGRKFDQVLEGARKVFLRDGFEGTSVDDIARQAGVSKATLYSYFPDKRLLFLAVAKAECHRQADEALQVIDQTAPPSAVLTVAARRMVGFFLSDFGVKVYRICVAESDRFPELGREFYQSGPLLLRQRLAEYLRGAVARGQLAISDIDLAADQFAELCKATIHNRAMFGITPCCAPGDVQRTITGAVEMFMARYGTKPAA